MTTLAMTPAAAEAALEEIYRGQGLSERAIGKLLTKFRNLLTRAHPRLSANTDTPNTNTLDDLDEDGRMLDLAHQEPPGWVSILIRAALAARGIAESRWREAWSHFRSWNRDKQDKPWIAVRALKKWLETCKLRGMSKPPASASIKPERQKAQPKKADELQFWKAKASIALFDNQEADLIRLIGSETYERRVSLAMRQFDCGRKNAQYAVHGSAVERLEI